MLILIRVTLRKQLVILTVLTSLVMLGMLSNNVAAQNCGVQYQVSSKGASYPGATVTIANNFTNSGSFAVQITAITLTIDFGTFSAPSSQLPLPAEVIHSQLQQRFNAVSRAAGSRPVSAPSFSPPPSMWDRIRELPR
jgi:hypothetical protein